ncbi:MAG: hypothetical protein FK732_09275 [Asgard group archaeon]|nr:hypothetical protein [Asgard group archaeon]
MTESLQHLQQIISTSTELEKQIVEWFVTNFRVYKKGSSLSSTDNVMGIIPKRRNYPLIEFQELGKVLSTDLEDGVVYQLREGRYFAANCLKQLQHIIQEYQEELIRVGFLRYKGEINTPLLLEFASFYIAIAPSIED